MLKRENEEKNEGGILTAQNTLIKTKKHINHNNGLSLTKLWFKNPRITITNKDHIYLYSEEYSIYNLSQ